MKVIPLYPTKVRPVKQAVLNKFLQKYTDRMLSDRLQFLRNNPLYACQPNGGPAA